MISMYKSDHIEKAAQDFWAKEKCFESSEETKKEKLDNYPSTGQG